MKQAGQELAELRPMLRHRRHYVASGGSDRQLRLAVQRGELLRIARGWYVQSAAWNELSHRSRHLLRVLAVQQDCAAPQLHSHGTAGTLLELPMVRFDARRVHVLLRPDQARHHSGVLVRHRGRVDDGQTQLTAGIRHTGLARTVVDIARTMSFESGVVVADAALRRSVLREGVALDEARATLLEVFEREPRAAGNRRARNVLRFAGALSESPLESLARLQLARLGFAVAQQVPVRGPNGERLRMDFELLGHDVFFEADGKQKYFDEQMRGGRSIEQVVFDEKVREDWVRGTERKRVVRVGWQDVGNVARTAVRLRAFGIEPPLTPDGKPELRLY